MVINFRSTYRFLRFAMPSVLLLFACSRSASGVAPATPLKPVEVPLPSPAVQVVQLHTATPESIGVATTAPFNTPASGPPARPGEWVEVRDERYGFALAAPCWWVVSPIPAEGMGGVMTLRNYDDAYFMANSTKGWWTGGDWPEGVMKLDLATWEGFDPALNTLEAYKTSLDPGSSEIASVEEVRIGVKEALRIEMRNLVNPNDPLSRLYLLRLSKSALLLVSAAPDRALDSSDVQAILNSLVLSSEQAVELPHIAPSPPIIPLPEGCRQ